MPTAQSALIVQGSPTSPLPLHVPLEQFLDLQSAATAQAPPFATPSTGAQRWTMHRPDWQSAPTLQEPPSAFLVSHAETEAAGPGSVRQLPNRHPRFAPHVSRQRWPQPVVCPDAQLTDAQENPLPQSASVVHTCVQMPQP